MSDNFPRKAIVTGSDSGIGKATAELLATEGFDVGLTCHSDVAGLQDTVRQVEERGQRAFVEAFGASRPDPGDVVDRLAEQMGGLGVLVNPTGRPGHVAEVAAVIGFLVSPRASYVTGSSYVVDGRLADGRARPRRAGLGLDSGWPSA